LKRYLREYLSLAAVAGTIIAFDQFTKALVRANLRLAEVWTPFEWLPFLRIVHWRNTGAAFGMLPGFGDVFTVLAIIVAIAILFYYPRVPKEERTLRFAMGLQLGGALGNLIDRLTLGHVIDFVAIGPFPVFNVADASISTGVAILLIGVWLKERGKEADQPLQEEEGPAIMESGRQDGGHAEAREGAVIKPAPAVASDPDPQTGADEEADPVSEERWGE
jgi:signal peptidase II